jgi:hypothetical protein
LEVVAEAVADPALPAAAAGKFGDCCDVDVVAVPAAFNRRKRRAEKSRHESVFGQGPTASAEKVGQRGETSESSKIAPLLPGLIIITI